MTNELEKKNLVSSVWNQESASQVLIAIKFLSPSLHHWFLSICSKDLSGRSFQSSASFLHLLHKRSKKVSEQTLKVNGSLSTGLVRHSVHPTVADPKSSETNGNHSISILGIWIRPSRDLRVLCTLKIHALKRAIHNLVFSE